MNTMSDPDPKDEIASVAFELWQAEGQPEGRDQEHWLRAERLVEDARAKTNLPEATAGNGGRMNGQADEQSQDSAQTPSDKPGPRNPPPLPVTNAEGFVAVPEDAPVPSADPAPPEAAAPPLKSRRKVAGRKPVLSN